MDVTALMEGIVYVLIAASLAVVVSAYSILVNIDIIKPRIRAAARVLRMIWFFLNGTVIGWVTGTFLAVLVYGEIGNTLTQVQMIAYILWVLVVLLTLLYGVTFISYLLFKEKKIL